MQRHCDNQTLIRRLLCLIQALFCNPLLNLSPKPYVSLKFHSYWIVKLKTEFRIQLWTWLSFNTFLLMLVFFKLFCYLFTNLDNSISLEELSAFILFRHNWKRKFIKLLLVIISKDSCVAKLLEAKLLNFFEQRNPLKVFVLPKVDRRALFEGQQRKKLWIRANPLFLKFQGLFTKNAAQKYNAFF